MLLGASRVLLNCGRSNVCRNGDNMQLRHYILKTDTFLVKLRVTLFSCSVYHLQCGQSYIDTWFGVFVADNAGILVTKCILFWSEWGSNSQPSAQQHTPLNVSRFSWQSKILICHSVSESWLQISGKLWCHQCSPDNVLQARTSTT